MNRPKLFDQETKDQGNNLSNYCNLKNTSDNESLRLKKIFENWFEKVQDTEKNRLKKDFQSEDNHTHWSGFFELYLHELFTQSGYTIECHKISDKTKRTPDFYLENEDYAFYVEAITRSDSYSDKNNSVRQNITIQFFESLEISKDVIIGIKRIPFRKPEIISIELDEKIKPFLESILDKSNDYKERYNSNGWELDFSIASDNKERGKCHPISMISEWNVYDYISSAVEKKHPSNYKLQNKPFIIAINIHPVNSEPINYDMVSDAVFGNVINVPESELIIYTESIFAAYDKNSDEFVSDNEEISGLLIIDNLDTLSIADKKATLYINPRSNNPIRTDILPIDTLYYDEEKNKIVEIKGKRSKELFDI